MSVIGTRIVYILLLKYALVKHALLKIIVESKQRSGSQWPTLSRGSKRLTDWLAYRHCDRQRFQVTSQVFSSIQQRQRRAKKNQKYGS